MWRGEKVDLSETTAKTQLLEALRWLRDASNASSNQWVIRQQISWARTATPESILYYSCLFPSDLHSDVASNVVIIIRYLPQRWNGPITDKTPRRLWWRSNRSYLHTRCSALKPRRDMWARLGLLMYSHLFKWWWRAWTAGLHYPAMNISSNTGCALFIATQLSEGWSIMTALCRRDQAWKRSDADEDEDDEQITSPDER